MAGKKKVAKSKGKKNLQKRIEVTNIMEKSGRPRAKRTIARTSATQKRRQLGPRRPALTKRSITNTSQPPLFAPNVTLEEKLQAIVRAGREKNASPRLLSFFSTIIADKTEETLLRAYASWALDCLYPRPAGNKPLVYHVDTNASNASDDNPGTMENPWKTIQRAAETLCAGDTVMVHGGIYREFVQPFREGISYDRMITYAAAPGEKVIIKAMDIWKPHWQDQGNGVWSAAYTPHAWDKPGRYGPSRPASRTEQVFVDGKLLTHLEKKDECIATPGAMFLDDETSRIWINLGAHRDPFHTVIERSVRQQCFFPAVRGLGYIKVKGFTMIGGAAHTWTGGNWHDIDQTPVCGTDAGHHWIIEDNTIEWGNAQGLGLAAGGFAESRRKIPIVTVDPNADWKEVRHLHGGFNIARRNRVNYHGISGIVGIGDCRGIVVEDCEVVGNCVKPNQGTCEEAGIKFHVLKNSVIRRCFIKDNAAYGVWIDAGCETNRVSQNIFINNHNHAIFHEISEGPVLVDNNVIIDDRPAPAQCGFYTHDGNRAIVVNNAVFGVRLGARVRALFHRSWGPNRMTTTSHNHFYNNLFADNAEGGVSLMPEVPRCEDNTCAGNGYWNRGMPVDVRIENTSDVGVRWESLPVGKALGFSGGGDRRIALDAWARYTGNDADAAPIAPQLLFDDLSPQAMRDALVAAWKRRGLDLDDGYFSVEPETFAKWVQSINPQLAGWRLLHTLFLAPDAGVQIWSTGQGLRLVRWSGAAVCRPELLHAPELAYAPIDAPVKFETLAVGETIRAEIPRGWRIIETGLGASIEGAQLIVAATQHQKPGVYALVLSNGEQWTLVRIAVAPAFAIDRVREDRSLGNAVCVAVSNHSNTPADGTVRVTIGNEEQSIACRIEAHEQREFRLPVACANAGEAAVQVRFGATTLAASQLVSFAVARIVDTWEDARLYGIYTREYSFPGGVFPDGAEYGFLYQKGRLRAGWRARYCNDGLLIRVEAEHATHHALRSDMDGIHTQDGVKIAIKGAMGDRAAVIGMALRSDTGEQVFGFNKTANEKKYPIGQSAALRGSIVRSGEKTVYEVMIAWDMINRSSPPEPGSCLPLSIFLSKNDGDQQYGLQWFFGIKYDEREGDEAWMGRLWFE